MRLKQRIGDFRVRELLDESYLSERGQYRVYRVTKRKLTTPEAVDILAAEAGVDKGDVGLAGWKDRQGITIQYMSVPRGRKVRLQAPELLIDTEGFADQPYSSEFSRGNAFEINVRDLDGGAIARMRTNLPLVRENGVIDYFDDQRFGNLTHGQGWIAKDLALGRYEEALRALLALPSTRDNEHFRRFKAALQRSWGDWRDCRDVAGRFGAHHSVFEYLGKNDGDFAGAFTHISSRVRLIHLFAWQSHLWNRAVAEFVRDATPLEDRVLIESEEGVLVMPSGTFPAELRGHGKFWLPGEQLEGVEDPQQRAALEEALAQEGMVRDQLKIEGVSGFFMKAEARPLCVMPEHLRVRPAIEDPLNRGARMLRVRFELPRGSYASLVIKRLFAGAQRSRPTQRPNQSAGGYAPQGTDRGRSQGYRQGDGGGRGGARRGNSGGYRGDDRGLAHRGDDRGPGDRRGRDRREEYRRGDDGRGGYRGGKDDRGGSRGGNDGRSGYRGRDDGRGGYRGGNDDRSGQRGRDDGRSGYRGGNDDRGGQRGREDGRGGQPGSGTGGSFKKNTGGGRSSRPGGQRPDDQGRRSR